MNEINKHYASVDNERNGRNPEAGIGEAASERYDEASSWAKDRYDDAVSWASDRYDSLSRNATYARRRSTVHLGRQRQNVERIAEESPIVLGVVGLAAGLLVGALLPGTRRENRYFGRYADDMREQGLQYAHDLAAQGRHAVEEGLNRSAEALHEAANEPR